MQSYVTMLENTISKVSVIVPLYNTESYIRDCILSLTRQTLKEIEIIVINDGSTDGGPDIVRDLARNDLRIHLFSQVNQGLSAARNAGVSHVSGEFIYFMDSDDLLEEDALELCYNKCKKDNLDFVLFDAESFKDNDASTDYWMDYQRSKYIDDKVYDGKKLLDYLISIKKYRASACLNVISTSFYLNARLSFYRGILHEDELCTAIMYMEAARVGKIDRAFFKRRIRNSSIMSKPFSNRNIDSYLTVAAELKKYAKTHDSEVKRVVNHLISYFINPAISNSWSLTFSKRCQILWTCISNYATLIKPKNILVLLFKSFIDSIRKK